MTEVLLFLLIFVSALGCGLVAGVFFAFSSFVIKALTRLPAPQGIAAMQSVNVVAVTPLFMTALFGVAVMCSLLAVWSGLVWDESRAVYLLIGSLLYLIGTIGVTIVCNVPRNNALAVLKAESSDSVSRWAELAGEWTTWNHVRTIAALAAAALFTIALCLP
jgi:uncharacterized membrane protein